MDTPFWWIFDALVVVLALFFIYSNAKRGLTKVFIMAIGYIVATLFSSVLSAVAAPTFYELVARDSNISTIREINSEMDVAQVFFDEIKEKRYGVTIEKSKIRTYLLPPDTESYDVKLYEYVNHRCGYQVTTQQAFSAMLQNAFAEEYGELLKSHLPNYAYAQFQEMFAEDQTLVTTVLDQMYSEKNTTRDFAIYIEDTFVKNSTIEVFRIFIYLILFSVMMVFAALIASMMEYRLIFNVRPFMEHLLGGFIGVIEAGIMVALLTISVRLLILLGGGTLLCFNEPTVMASKLFRFFYNQLSILL
ncbi:MAG: hypothetical protein IKM30_08210 [Oscillospiraceae bacterium]|nr:hypothetical protein [Oscillospiraceae bacterium]